MRIANARLVNLHDGGADEPIDLWIADGRLSRSPGSDDEPTIDVAGRFVLPGLWDAHVHMTQWAQASRRIDLSQARDTGAVLDAIAAELFRRPGWATDPIVAGGVRSATWAQTPTGAQLDALSDDVAIVVLGGDLHSAWANRAALDRFGFDDVPSGRLVEQAAFDLQLRLTTASTGDLDAWVGEAAHAAAALGVTGIVDMEMADNLTDWSRRMDAGFADLRVRAAVWPDLLDQRIDAGLRTGDAVGGHPLLTQGPLKVIADGSITARTAWCRDPYGPDATRGISNVDCSRLADLMGRAAMAGIDCAIHGIGDAAIDEALAAFADSHAHGSIEHAQLATPDQAAAMAAMALTASVQPQHLADDRDPCDALWPGRPVLPFAMLRDAGVRLAFGSDAPVARLNPWDAVERAVTRTADERAAWQPDQRVSLSIAMQASTAGVCRLVPGAPADLIVLDENPFDVEIDRLHTFGSAVTVVAGEVVHSWL